jgi:hypothetical protein
MAIRFKTNDIYVCLNCSSIATFAKIFLVDLSEAALEIVKNTLNGAKKKMTKCFFLIFINLKVH